LGLVITLVFLIVGFSGCTENDSEGIIIQPNNPNYEINEEFSLDTVRYKCIEFKVNGNSLNIWLFSVFG